MDFIDISTYITSDTHRLIASAALGALIGLERELAGKDPSLRTFSLICMGSCLFSMISASTAFGVPNADPGRIAAQLVTGIGFLGAGAIFKSGGGVSGLTTAALIWMTAAVGMAIGLHRSDVAISGTFIALLTVILLNLVHRTIRKLRPQFYDKP